MKPFLGLLACLYAVSALSMAASAKAAPSESDWLGHDADFNATNYGPQVEISTGNISRLGLVWSLYLPGQASLEATPLEVAGVIYFTGTYGAVYAVDVQTGKLLWRYDPQSWRVAPKKMRLIFSVNRGPAYAAGRIFSAALDGRLFALDAKTGKLLWSVQTVPVNSNQFITGAPLTFDGKVLIGGGGSDFNTRGQVGAYDQVTGKRLWRFYTVPGSPEQNQGDPAMLAAAATWHGAFWKIGGGGTVWNGMTYDPEFNRVYIGTANAGPQNVLKRSPGGGDNLYTASIVALDADTGKYVWDYQMVPGDVWDYDCTEQITLADLKIGGKTRKVLMQAPKNGFFYVIDRTDGRLISAAKIVKVSWASRIDLRTGRPVEVPGQRYEAGTAAVWPSATGAHGWQAMSYDPETGLVYIPTIHEGETLRRGAPGPGEVDNGGIAIATIPPAPGQPMANLLAWNPVTQKSAWRVDQSVMLNGGTLATGGGLVFQGSADGYLYAYDAKTGKQLWRFYAGLGIMAPPITYAVDGKQYVSVLVGFGSSAGGDSGDMAAGWNFAAPRRLLTFALDGKALLPPAPARFAKLQLLDDPALKLDPNQVVAGSTLFPTCSVCHGQNAVGAGGPGPDLRASPIAFDPNSLWRVLHDGVLLPAGMPSFPELTHDQVMDIYAYIRSQARTGLADRATMAK